MEVSSIKGLAEGSVITNTLLSPLLQYELSMGLYSCPFYWFGNITCSTLASWSSATYDRNANRYCKCS